MKNDELINIINSWFPEPVQRKVETDELVEPSTGTEKPEKPNEDAPVPSNGLLFSEEGSEFLNLEIRPEFLHQLMSELKNHPNTHFDYLFCLSGVDWGEELGVVYHLESTIHRHIMVVKVKTQQRDKPLLDTVSDIWATAEFHEREVYDFFGIKFKGHPNLKRLFLTDEWKGYPLRKDYVDEVNMIVK